jgi:hypothetical protein
MDPTPSPPRQLALPFAPPAATPSPPPLADVTIRPRALWRRLSPAQQHRVRRALVRICQEVLHADPQR